MGSPRQRTAQPLLKPVVAIQAAQTSVQLAAASGQQSAERPNRRSGSHAQECCHRGDGDAVATRQPRSNGDGDACNDVSATLLSKSRSPLRAGARARVPTGCASPTTPTGKSLRSTSPARTVGLLEPRELSRRNLPSEVIMRPRYVLGNGACEVLFR